MSNINYVEWDIEDIGGHYEFTPQEMMSTDYLDMINLLKRGSGEVTYTFNCDSSIPKGTTITVRNNEFGADNNGNFFGIQILLNPDTTAPRSSYWFFFQDQVESFTFNGVFWKCNSPEPVPVAEASFIDDETMPSGYLDISAYNEDLKKILFSNVNMNNFDPSVLFSVDEATGKSSGRFFRDGITKEIQEDAFGEHQHKSTPHSHKYGPSVPVPAHLRIVMSYIKEFERLKRKGLNSRYLHSNILITALIKNKKKITIAIEKNNISLSFEEVLQKVHANIHQIPLQKQMSSLLNQLKTIDLSVSTSILEKLKNKTAIDLKTIIETLQSCNVDLNPLYDTVNSFCLCGKNCLSDTLKNNTVNLQEISFHKEGKRIFSHSSLCSQLLSSIEDSISDFIDQIIAMYTATLAVIDTTPKLHVDGDVPVAMPFYQIMTGHSKTVFDLACDVGSDAVCGWMGGGCHCNDCSDDCAVETHDIITDLKDEEWRIVGQDQVIPLDVENILDTSLKLSDALSTEEEQYKRDMAKAKKDKDIEAEKAILKTHLKYRADVLKQYGPSVFPAIWKILKNAFHIYRTSPEKVTIKPNEGPTETRPNNIKGRYIIKCF